MKILFGIIAVVIIAAALGGSDDESSTYDPPVVSDPDDDFEPIDTTDEPEIEITAEMVVDIMDPEAVQGTCDAMDIVGDYDLALSAFKTGYKSAEPPANEVLDEILSRC